MFSSQFVIVYVMSYIFKSIIENVKAKCEWDSVSKIHRNGSGLTRKRYKYQLISAWALPNKYT